MEVGNPPFLRVKLNGGMVTVKESFKKLSYSGNPVSFKNLYFFKYISFLPSMGKQCAAQIVQNSLVFLYRFGGGQGA